MSSVLFCFVSIMRSMISLFDAIALAFFPFLFFLLQIGIFLPFRLCRATDTAAAAVLPKRFRRAFFSFPSCEARVPVFTPTRLLSRAGQPIAPAMFVSSFFFSFFCMRESKGDRLFRALAQDSYTDVLLWSMNFWF